MSLEELCIDVSCGLVHCFLFSDREEVLAGAVWFPKRTAPLLGQPVAPWGAVTLEDPLLQAAWVLCLLIPIFSPVFSGLQGDYRHNSEEKEDQN